jgi:hypothetical protein
MHSTKGAWLAGRRLTAIDGFGMEAPDSEENAAYFGYAGKERSERVPARANGRAGRAARTRSSPLKSRKTEKVGKCWPGAFCRAARLAPG